MPSSWSKITFYTLSVVVILYFLNKILATKPPINPPLINLRPTQPPMDLRIIITPKPKIDLFNKKISFEIDKIIYKGTIYAAEDTFVYTEKIYRAEDLVPSMINALNSMKDKIRRTYYIECENSHKTFSYEKILLVTDYQLIQDEPNQSQLKSLLPTSCTLL